MNVIFVKSCKSVTLVWCVVVFHSEDFAYFAFNLEHFVSLSALVTSGAGYVLNFLNYSTVSVACFKLCKGFPIASREPMRRVCEITVTVYQFQKCLFNASRFHRVPRSTNSKTFHVLFPFRPVGLSNVCSLAVII